MNKQIINEELENIFIKIFDALPKNKDSWSVLGVENWDSLVHMILMAEIEKTFDITIPSSDYLKCTSYYEILKKVEMLQYGR